MKHMGKLVALILVMALLTGCTLMDQIKQAAFGQPVEGEQTAYGGMTYVHPDMEEHDRVLEESCRIARTDANIGAVEEAIYAYYDVYDRIYASYDLAYIHYCTDVTDTYWAQEYEYCSQVIVEVDAGLESLYYALAQSPVLEVLESESYFGAGYFDAYQGENPWDDPELVELMNRETALIDEYYAICAEAEAVEYYSDAYFETYGTRMAQVFVELIAVRQEMAAWFGYDSYPEFAYDCYHYRDYTPAQAESYLESVGAELVELYVGLGGAHDWEYARTGSTTEQTLAYVRECANAMGGDAADAFSYMESNRLYEIAPGENKYPISFETLIYYYYVPFVFMCPEETVYDKLTFSHEFGHFLADYVCDGSYAGTDVAEVHSQAMEYLSLFYCQDTQELEALKMADSLCVYVEQSAYALFEHQVYGLEGEDLTAENVRALYEQIGTRFGFTSIEWDSRDYVTIPHLFVQPMYMVSYVVSNDLAMQIYQLEKEESGAGLAVYEQCLYSADSYIMTFADSYGLESPFAPDRLEAVKKTFEEILQ